VLAADIEVLCRHVESGLHTVQLNVQLQRIQILAAGRRRDDKARPIQSEPQRQDADRAGTGTPGTMVRYLADDRDRSNVC
jgi:hypothetical protein